MSAQHDPTPVKRTLVIADLAAGSDEFAAAVAAHCGDNTEVFLVVPGRDRKRVARSLSRLARQGVFAWGRTGPSDPLAAVADGLHHFAPDELLVVADARRESHRLGVSTARRLWREFGLPVAHVRVGIAAAERSQARPRVAAPVAPVPA